MRIRRRILPLFIIFGALGTISTAAEYKVASPDGRLALIISDDHGLRYSVEVDHQRIIDDSALGLEFEGGITLGPTARVIATKKARHNGTWDNPFGIERHVPDNWRELRLTLRQPTELNAGGDATRASRTFGLIARAYDGGVAFRYDLPEAVGMREFTLTRELTEFRFAGDYRCWAGGESPCAETTYGETRLAGIPSVTGDRNHAGAPYRSVLPLLVETPAGYVAVAESDLLDWAGLFLTGTGTPDVRATLAPREDGRGLVVGTTPHVSPWRVLIIAHDAAGLVTSNLVATLATPSRVKDASWVHPGACAWDAWWTGENPYLPRYTGLDARGDTRSHKEYIDLAAEMGWPYQLVDWFWYEHMTSYNKGLLSAPNHPSGDFMHSVPAIDLPGLVDYARTKHVRLWVWAHSLDLETFGVDKAFDHFASLGIAGVKIDFIGSDSQLAVQWCEKVLASAAARRLMVDFHGTYKPTGLARTYPNFVTQEGVLGNEYNKLPGNRCDARHTIILPFTRALLGPMDFTPGGFLNRTPETFRVTHPAEVIGTRARQLAMTVIYPSPLLVFCDSPAHYRGQPGVEFLRDLPTVWDETVVLSADVGKQVVLARRSGANWWLAAMNGDAASDITVSLAFLDKHGRHKWQLHEFSDGTDPAVPEDVMESTHPVANDRSLNLHLSPAGGYSAVLERD